MTTLNTQLKRLAGMVGTSDLTEWENGFVKGLLERTRNGDDTSKLTDKQIETLERLHDKHFGG